MQRALHLVSCSRGSENWVVLENVLIFCILALNRILAAMQADCRVAWVNEAWWGFGVGKAQSRRVDGPRRHCENFELDTFNFISTCPLFFCAHGVHQSMPGHLSTRRTSMAVGFDASHAPEIST